MRILIAPNAFKNSLAAADVADAIKEGLQQSNLECSIRTFPVGDGGDGTAALLIQHCGGEIIDEEVHDPLGRKIPSSFGLIDGGRTAVIEMADASGLRLLQANELDPLHANSFGTGELLIHALNKKVAKIVLCIGGSATVDGAAGILQALGFHFLDKNNEELNQMPETLAQLSSIDFSGIDGRIMNCKIIVLCDVENILLGKQGAAAVFGPQKGATPADVKKLEVSLTKLRDVILQQTGKDMGSMRHGGAAGGVAAGLAALLNAQLVNGIDYFLSITNFDRALEQTDLVITGEGSMDIQTLDGKGPFGVAKKSKESKIPVIALAGKIATEAVKPLKQYFDLLIPINKDPVNLSNALLHTGANLTRAAEAIGRSLATKKMKFD